MEHGSKKLITQKVEYGHPVLERNRNGKNRIRKAVNHKVLDGKEK